MKLKKMLAGALISVLAVGCIPNMNVSKLSNVDAKTFPDVDTEWYEDTNGNMCKLLFQYTGWKNSEESTPPESAQGYIQGDWTKVFDNDLSTKIVGRGNQEGYANDGIQSGDYVGVLYQSPVTVERFTLVHDEIFTQGVLEYTTDSELGVDSWVPVEEVRLATGDQKNYTKVFTTPVEGVYGVRIRSTVTERRWVNVREIIVTPPSDVLGATLEQVAPSTEAKAFDVIDHNNNVAKFFLRQNGVPATTYSNSLSNMFDNNVNSETQFKGPQLTIQGDYFGMYYNQPIDVKRIQVVYANEANDFDCFAESHFEYYDLNNGWTRLGDTSFSIEKDGKTNSLVLNEVITTNAVRVVKDSSDERDSWLRIAEFKINSPTYANYEANDVDYYYIKTVTEGSANSSTVGANDGPGLNVIDGDNSTLWHTNYSLTNQEDCWIQFELEEAMLVDGVRVFLRGDGTNGFINAYDIETSVDGVNYTLVCSGTWNSSGWRTAKFEPTTAKYVRLTATDSDVKNLTVCAAICEMRITTPTSNIEYVDFWGGGLRRASTYEKTNMRFGYEIPNVVEGMNATSWEWSWVAEDASKLWTEDAKTVSGTNFYDNEAGDGRVSNLVITGIPKAAYTTNVYAQLAITYTIGSEELTVYTDVQVRTVEQVANAVKDSSVESQENRDYARGLLGVIGQ